MTQTPTRERNTSFCWIRLSSRRSVCSLSPTLPSLHKPPRVTGNFWESWLKRFYFPIETGCFSVLAQSDGNGQTKGNSPPPPGLPPVTMRCRVITRGATPGTKATILVSAGYIMFPDAASPFARQSLLKRSNKNRQLRSSTVTRSTFEGNRSSLT